MFDPTKPVQTRDGRKARIVATINSTNYPIIAVVTTEDGAEFADSFTKDGSQLEGSERQDRDLINIPEKRVYERWVNVWPSDISEAWDTKQEADENSHDRIACIHIRQEYTVGEGLE